MTGDSGFKRFYT